MSLGPRSSDAASRVSRRRFLADAGATALAATIVKPALVRGTAANARISLGIIGTGGRGAWLGDLFRKHGGYDVVAIADYFPDRVEEAGAKLGVPPIAASRAFSAYKRLLESKVDAVAIVSPPYFHPAQAADAVAAGKHVYSREANRGGRVPGCLSIEESGKKATSSKQCFLVDFQTRAMPNFVEANPARARRCPRHLRVRRGHVPRRGSIPREGGCREVGQPRRTPAPLGPLRGGPQATSSRSRTSMRST